MKIPQIFIPEKNLEDKTLNLLEKEITNECKGYDQDYDVSINKHVIFRSVLGNMLKVTASDDLRIQVCYNKRIEIVSDIPILKEIYEKTIIRNADQTKLLKEYDNAENKARNGLKKLEKHFYFNELIAQVQNDSELLSKMNEIFKDFSPGYYHFRFNEYGSVSLEGRGIFTGAHSIAVENLYRDYLSKYVVKDTERKGFLYNLRIGLRNLF